MVAGDNAMSVGASFTSVKVIVNAFSKKSRPDPLSVDRIRTPYEDSTS